MSFEKNLESLRKQKGWSQDDLADRLNLTRQAVSKWETGSSKPDIDNVKNISQLFSVKIDDLLNNEVVEDKAVSLNFEKKEKRENIIKTIKFAIIALVIVYLITVIYKFASLLIIVNGVQKYANLNNYHYVITTYDENGLKEKEECWFKDGVSKTVNTIYKDLNIKTTEVYVDYNKREGFTTENNGKDKKSINMDEYLLINNGYKDGKQFYSRIPIEIRDINLFECILKTLNNYDSMIKIFQNYIYFYLNESSVVIDCKTMMPLYYYSIDKNNSQFFIQNFLLDIGSIENVEI